MIGLPWESGSVCVLRVPRHPQTRTPREAGCEGSTLQGRLYHLRQRIRQANLTLQVHPFWWWDV